MFRQQTVDVHQFAMIPRAEIPRSRFVIQTKHKTTFDGGYLVPIFRMEVLPGDSVSCRATLFGRMSTPVFPIMDNLTLSSFFFFVPYRLLWANWKKFMGEQDNPGDSISYTIPQIVTPTGGYAIGSIFDYFGLPTVGQVGGGNTVSHSALPLRAYNRIFQDWFRDENMINSPTIDTGNGPDTYTDYALRRRGKRHDYFTSCLPWPQKGATAVTLPLGTTAPIIASGTQIPTFKTDADGTTRNMQFIASGAPNVGYSGAATGGTGNVEWVNPNLAADLSNATAATINQLRQSFQIQKLLERDARGGTRYTEIIRAHFGVTSPDARLQRPEYLGGGSAPINVNPIAQTSGTSASGTTTPLGNLAAMATALAGGHGFTQSFTEHGIIIGLAHIGADLTYQQGLERFWSRSTRYDFYFPAFAMLGEQSVLNKEIYCDGSANDPAVFGYQSRWDEYRYYPAMITSIFRSTASGTLDPWHLAQKFTAVPALNQTFIEDTPPISRVVAAGTAANGQQFIFDSFFNIKCARPMPMYSVPGLIDHF